MDTITRFEEHEAEAEEGEITVKDREVATLARQVLAENSSESARRTAWSHSGGAVVPTRCSR